MRAADTARKSWAVYLSGLLAAMATAAWMRPPAFGLSFGRAVTAAAFWMFATVLAGLLGLGAAESLLERRPAFPRMNFVVGAAATWVLLPPMLLCRVRGSGWAAVMGGLAGAAMAAALWGMAMRADQDDEEEPWLEGPRFADLPAPDSRPLRAFVIAVCAELAVVLANRGELSGATALMGVAGFLFVWKRLESLEEKVREGVTRPTARVSGTAILAMLILIPLLLARFAQMNGSVETRAQAATRADAQKGDGGASPDAYRGIVLFTVRDKSKELPPVPIERDLLRTGKARPLVIRFDGSYWYFQAPQHGPGIHPHLAQGDPVKASIFSTSWVPLAMQAHQSLAQAVDLRSVGAMQVMLTNGDNRRGRVDMGVLLTDTTAPGKPSMYLGTQPIVSTEPDHFAFKAHPVSEEVGFAIPARREIRKFDEITILFYPNAGRETMGARLGIEEFELEPK